MRHSLQFQPASGMLRVGEREARLRPRTANVLAYLLENGGRLVPKEELLNALWPDVVVTEDSLVQCVKEIRAAIGPSARELIRTMPKRGYTLVGSIHRTSRDSGRGLDFWTIARGGPLPEPADAGAPVAAQAGAPADRERPSVAVLAFANIGGDLAHEYFTDGITEDIITELSRFETLFVIARDSAFTYKGRQADVATVARELGVRYVVEGSIRRAGRRVKVSAQLIDSETGAHVWAEQYDRQLEDIFLVQEDVTACIVGAIAPQIDVNEALKARRRPGKLSAYEIAVKAKALAREGYQRWDRAARNEAVRLAREALALDPDSVLALGALAFAQWQHVLAASADDVDMAWEDGMQAAVHAIELAPASSNAYLCRAFLLAWKPGAPAWHEAALAAGVAYRLNPQDAFTAAGYGYLLASTGQAARGIELLEASVRANPRDPFGFVTFSNLAWACYVDGQCERGLHWAQMGINAAPNFLVNYIHRSRLLVRSGRLSEARAVFDSLRQRDAAYVDMSLKTVSTLPDAELRNQVVSDLRVAAGESSVAT